MKKSLEQKHNLLDAIYDDRLLITIGALWFVFFYVDVTYKGLLPESFFYSSFIYLLWDRSLLSHSVGDGCLQVL